MMSPLMKRIVDSLPDPAKAFGWQIIERPPFTFPKPPGLDFVTPAYKWSETDLTRMKAILAENLSLLSRANPEGFTLRVCEDKDAIEASPHIWVFKPYFYGG